MTMYDVFKHYYGRPVVQRGPMSGCVDFPQHRHEKVNARPVGLKRAQALADDCDCRAQVVEANTATVVYRNTRAPGLPEGWVRETFIER
jgi:hypothetical protein